MEEEQNAEGFCCDTTGRSAPEMLLRSLTGLFRFSLANKTEEGLSYKKFVHSSRTHCWISSGTPEYGWKNACLFCVLVSKHTRRYNHSLARTVVVARCLLPWSKSHTLLGRTDRSRRSGTPSMSWRRRPLPPTCSRYSVCRHYCPHSRHSGLAVCHPVVCYLRPEKRNRFGREEIANNVAKIPRKYVL